MEVDVLIPVYRPDGKLTELLKRLKMQNYPIHRVILMIMAGPETGESACRQQIWWSA